MGIYFIQFYLYVLFTDTIKERLSSSGFTNIRYGELALNAEPDILCWTLGDNARDLADVTCIYIGRDDQTLFNLTLSVSGECALNKKQ